jgi:hypothetical protein
VIGAGAAVWLAVPLAGPQAQAPERQVATGETPAAPDAVPAPPAESVPVPQPAAAAHPIAAPPPPAAPTEAPAAAPTPVAESGPSVPAPVLSAAPPVPPPPANAPRPWAQPVAPPPPPAVRPAAAPRDPVAASAARRADPEPPVRHAPAGAPEVRLSFLLFSPSPDRRSVALSIDGGSLETLHEGESTGSLDVVRILPDRVDLRWGGEPFTVRARD